MRNGNENARAVFRRPLLAAALAAGAAVGAGAAQAQSVDLFLTIDGIIGESLDAKFKGAIDVLSYTAGFAQTVARGAGAGAGKATCSPVVVVKNVDVATPPLVEGVMTGRRYKTADLSVRRSGESATVFYRIRLADVVLESLRQDGDRGERPSEAVALGFAQATIEASALGADGKPGRVQSTTVNCP